MASPSEEAQGLKRLRFKGVFFFCKLSFMILATIIVLIFQINRPKVPDVYYTSDPFKNMKNGIMYTCGCSLPPSLQSPHNPTDTSNVSSWKRCYDDSLLETVEILMYSNFTGVEKLEQLLEDSFPDKFNLTRKVRVVPGFDESMQGHTVAFDLKIFDSFTKKISSLYLGGYTQENLEAPIDYLVDRTQYGTQPLDFPTSYVALTFSFECNNSTSCALEKVNDIFTKISGENSDYEPWGDCVQWDRNNERGDGYNGSCAMYPIATVPLNFAIERFFQDFRDMPGIQRITPTQNPTRENYVSFSPNVLYLNLSQTFNRSVELNFFEIGKRFSPWLSFLKMFPSLDRECSTMTKTRTCNGTSMCNVFKSSEETDAYRLRCLHMENETQCLDIQGMGYSPPGEHLSIDDVNDDLWNGFNVHQLNWSGLLCMPYKCLSAPPYLILQQTAPAMQNSSLNKFLESKLLLTSWAQNAGLCTKTYTDIIKYNESGEIIFMEANCSQRRSNTDRFCWLTGRYHNLTDCPDEGWHSLVDQSSGPEDRFVCYNVANQNFFIWFILTFGILLGWLGTIQLIFDWIKHLFFHKRKKQTSNHETHVVDPHLVRVKNVVEVFSIVS